MVRETPPEPLPETIVPEQIGENEAKAFIYFKESTNKLDAVNSESGACGLGQSLPCGKMAGTCPNWQTDYDCQDKWFSDYAQKRYNGWVNAKVFWEKNRWW